MALQLTETYAGIGVTDAYHKIHHLSGSKDALHVDVSIYKDVTEANNRNAICSFTFIMGSGDLVHDDGVSDKNYTQQAYEFMKNGIFTDLSGTSRDYTGAVDV